MAVITATGPVEKKALGLTHAHEHIFADTSMDFVEAPQRIRDIWAAQGIDMEGGVTLANYGWLMREPQWSVDNQILDSYEDARDEMAIFKAAGGKTVCEPTPYSLGGDPLKLRRLSQELDMYFIFGSGFYRQKFHPPQAASMSVEDMEEMMFKDITEGVAGTGVRAGVLGELGTSGGQILPVERRTLIAAGRVNKRTNVPIYIHTEGYKEVILEAIQIINDQGGNPEKINICHVNESPHWEEVLKTGVTIGDDCFGSTFSVDSVTVMNTEDAPRVAHLKKMVEKGYAGKIIVGNDICMKMRLHKYGGWGYDHILTNLGPYFLKAGITEKQLEILFHDAPQNFLDWDN